MKSYANKIVTDNFLEESDYELLKTVVLGDDFPWFYNNLTANVTTNNINDFQFTHGFYRNFGPSSNYLKILDPILDKIKPFALTRIKANLQTRTESHHKGTIHTDNQYPHCITGIYYVNTNNGYTEFSDGEIVKSVGNRFVEFNSYLNHFGVSSTDTQVRCVLNFNYLRGDDSAFRD